MKLPPLKVRIVVGLILIILGVLPKTLPSIITNLIFGFVILLCFRISMRFAVKRFLFIIPFFLFSALSLVLLEGETGFHKAEIYTGRLLFVTMILTFMMFKTNHVTFIKALYQLHVPSIFVELAFFTLRFSDVFKVEIQHMFLSIRSKGFVTGKIFNLKTIKVFGHLLGSMLVRSLQRSDRIYLGMLSRGYTGQILQKEKEQVPIYEWLRGSFFVVCMFVLQIVF